MLIISVNYAVKYHSYMKQSDIVCMRLLTRGPSILIGRILVT